MPNQEVDAKILAVLPPGAVSAEWLDLSEQLGDDYKPATSGIIRASTQKGEHIFYAVNGKTLDPDDLIFLSITLPQGTVAAEDAQSTLLPTVTAALNALVSQQS